MRSSLMVCVITLATWGVISADDTSKPVATEVLPPIPASQPNKIADVPTPEATPKLPEIPKPSLKPARVPSASHAPSSSHMAPAPSSGITATTPRVINADQLLYERAAWQARERIARIEHRRWTGQSLSRPTINNSTYAALNPYLYGYPPAYAPGYRFYPWW